MNQTTYLEAVNILLATIGESPVQSLDGDQTNDVVLAKATLDEVIREVQSEGWSWNTEYDYVLSLSDANHINVPEAAAHIEFYPDPDVDPVRRGGFLWDRKHQQFEFSKPVKAARLVLMLNFDQMPEPARRYVLIRACRLFTQRALTSTEIVSYTVQDESRALAKLRQDEDRSQEYNFNANCRARRITRRNG